jgi:fermentation-respiration switch protein FrsA (DUF1100 family)
MTHDAESNLKSGRNPVIFVSAGSKLVGNLFCPEDFDAAKQYSAVVLGGPLSTVKEQAAGVYAEKLADRGYITLAFDYRTFGESEGEPRCYEDPESKSEDLKNAISFLASLKNIDKDSIGALSICASSSYMANALISDKRVKAFATVSAYFNLHSFFVDNPMMSEDQKAQMLKASNDARQKYFETGVADRTEAIWPEFTGEEDDIDSQEIYDYYYARVGECWPNFSRNLTVFSYEQLLRSNALDYAKFISTPYLGVVGSEAISRPLTEMFVEAKVHGENGIHVMEGSTHMQAYDNPKYVDEATSVVDAFFQKHLQQSDAVAA